LCFQKVRTWLARRFPPPWSVEELDAALSCAITTDKRSRILLMQGQAAAQNDSEGMAIGDLGGLRLV
jgi:hypothetical protein